MKGDAFTFFPGRGIYSTPNSGPDPILAIYEKEKAENIFSAFSYMVTTDKKGTKKLYSKDVIGYAKKLFDLHGTITPRYDKKREKSHGALSFDATAVCLGTRVSFNSKEVPWQVIEGELLAQGYYLTKREYLNGFLDNLVQVYMVVHADTGVIAEGKGFTEEQAKYSALAEAVERLYSQPRDLDQIIVDSQVNLYRGSQTGLSVVSGPRDTFSENVVTEWIDAVNVITGEKVFLPAEISYFKYIPQIIRLKLFSLYHTTGLAVGSSVEEAVLSGIFEIMERDAYWITMRCKLNHPDIDTHSIQNLDPKVLETLAALKKKGLDVYLKDMSLDWGVPIAHAVIVDTNKKIPAFSHGSGAAFDWATAISRAVAEVVQMHSGMIDFTNIPDNWERIVSAGDVLGRGELAWSDPLFRPHINHLIAKSEQKFSNKTSITTPEELLSSMRDKKYAVVCAKLNEIFGLNIVRVYIPEATQPDERLERISARMENFRLKKGLDGFYCDPILT